MLAWAGLSVLLALAAYGLVSEGLLGQSPLWYPEGWRRLGIFTAGFAVWTAVIVARWRAWFPAITLGAMLALTCAAVGPAAPGTVILFLLGSLAAGRMLGAGDGGIALLCGLGVYMLAGYCLVPWRVNYAIVYLLLLAVPVVIGRNEIWQALQRKAAAFQSVCWLDIPISYVLALHWIVALNPEVSSDGLAMHLAIPAKVAQLHSWPFDAWHTTWAVMPMGADWCYMIVYLSGGETAARLLNFAIAVVTAGLLGFAARHWAGETGARWTVLLYLTSPMVHLVTGNLFVETFWAALPFGALLALWRFEEHGERRSLFHAAWLLGCAGMVKLGALAFAAAMLPFALFAIRKHRPRAAWAASLPLLIPAAIPYAIAYRVTGNPVFPFTAPAAATPDITFLYGLVFRTSRWLESQDGAFGFQYFLLAPLALCLAGRAWRFREWSALGVAAISAAVIARAQPNARYLYPSLAFFSVGVAIVLGRFRPATGVAALCAALNFYFLPASSHSNKAFTANPFSSAARTGFLRTGAPVRDLVEWMNREHSGEAALFIGNPQIAGFAGKAYTDSWHHQPFQQRLSEANDDSALRSLFAAEAIRLFTAPVPGEGRFLNHVPLQSFLGRWTVPGPRNGGYYVAILSDQPREDPPLQPLEPGTHDDADPRIRYSGAWRRDTQFAEASGGTLVYANDPGAAVRFQFQGSAFVWIHTGAHNRGRALVSIDGGAPSEAGLRSAATQWRRRLRFAATPGRHSVEIRNAGGGYIDVDAIAVE